MNNLKKNPSCISYLRRQPSVRKMGVKLHVFILISIGTQLSIVTNISFAKPIQFLPLLKSGQRNFQSCTHSMCMNLGK
jgi:hypothetical protein